MESHNGGIARSIDEVFDEEDKYTDNKQQSGRTDCGQQARSMVWLQQVRPWLGLLLNYPINRNIFDTLLPLADGQDKKGNTQRGG